ncbi:MAG: lytic transglycosylase domain-containing protein [Patescibacteria group bacterium]
MFNRRKIVNFSLIAILLLALGFAGYLYLPKFFADQVYPLKYQEWIVQYSKTYGVDPALVAAVILQESNYNPNAVSPVGAQGLMQFMPGTAATMAKEVGLKKYDIFDPETSINFGAAHLRDLLTKYNGNVDAALAAYNNGTGSVDSWIRLGFLNRVSQSNYVKKIKNYQRIYQTYYAEQLNLQPVELKASDPKTQESEIRGLIWTRLFANLFKL